MHELYSIHYSPWSERARFALDCCGVSYKKREYLPTLGEFGLRRRLGKWRGAVSVPVLCPDDGPPLDDSFAIAQWAAVRGASALITDANRSEVSRYNDLASRALEAGRLLTTQAVLADPEALRESLPGPIRKLGRVGLVIGRDAANRLLRKYALSDAPEGDLAQALEQLRAGLSGRETLFEDGFSYADITAAVALHFVRPPEAPYIRLGPRSRACWTRDGLSRSFEDLLAWRDALYATHRTPQGTHAR